MCLWPDNDEPGRKHMERIAEQLQGIADEVLVYTWYEAKNKGDDAADHPAVQSRDPKAVDRLLTDLEGAPRWKPGEVSLASPSPNGKGHGGHRFRAIRFNDIPEPEPRRYLLDGLIPENYPTILHGDGGVAKSMIALSFGLAVSRGGEWLGRDVGAGSPVLYLDFELDAAEQRRRLNRLACGANLDRLPDTLLYGGALGIPIRDALRAAVEECRYHSVKLMILDSMGMALGGNAEAAQDVIGFFNDVMEPFRAAGVTVLVIDHQSRLQAGQKYQDKGTFGSAYKEHLARSRIQVEATDRAENVLTVRLRHKKHNFGPLAEPFEVKLTFTEEAVALEALNLSAADLADEGTLSAKERVRLALKEGPAYPAEIADATDLALKTVKNKLSELRKAGEVEPTGTMDGQAEQVSLVSPSLIGDRDGDTGKVEEPVMEAEVF